VLLGGVQTLVGPIVGASIFTWLHDSIARETEYWKAVLGMVILFLVLLFPAGVVGSLSHFWHWIVARKKEGLNPVSIKAKEAS